MDSDYVEEFYPPFNSHFKACLKNFRHTFEEDFGRLRKVVLIERESASCTDKIANLGSEVSLPVYKIHMHVKQASGKIGRVIFILDKPQKRIVYVDIYTKNKQSNHDSKWIREAYTWYVEYISKVPPY
ncbi:MAG: hypothetical protein V1875_05290 [Candidatus Altiarchaeota archaeon]